MDQELSDAERAWYAEMDLRLTHAFEHLEAMDADSTLPRGQDPGAAARLDRLVADMKDIHGDVRFALAERPST